MLVKRIERKKSTAPVLELVTDTHYNPAYYNRSHFPAGWTKHRFTMTLEAAKLRFPMESEICFARQPVIENRVPSRYKVVGYDELFHSVKWDHLEHEPKILWIQGITFKTSAFAVAAKEMRTLTDEEKALARLQDQVPQGQA